ncbi:maleylpyruvate isomerase family mycothiol-dependent enzyme [Streptomyces sp. NPDC002067]
MEITEFVEALRLDGALLAAAAEEAGPDAPIPACPEWRMRDLVVHVGRVHRWATGYVTEGLEHPSRPDEAPDLADQELVPWLREGHHRLVLALHEAPESLGAWTFLPASSPLTFWARRQAHETAIHRADAQQALGVTLTPLPPAFAADGVDEILTGIHSQERSRVRTTEPKTLRVRATDAADAGWTVHLSEAPARTLRTLGGAGADEPADLSVEGPAEALYLTLWNRAPWDALTVKGDEALVRLWEEHGGI